MPSHLSSCLPFILPRTSFPACPGFLTSRPPEIPLRRPLVPPAGTSATIHCPQYPSTQLHRGKVLKFKPRAPTDQQCELGRFSPHILSTLCLCRVDSRDSVTSHGSTLAPWKWPHLLQKHPIFPLTYSIDLHTDIQRPYCGLSSRLLLRQANA